jgi:RNA polymerase sigma-70 factor (ECF subfamily)
LRLAVYEGVSPAASAALSAPDLTDEDLVASVLGGDREAFAFVVNRHKRGVANFIGASIRSASDVADLTQETFLRAYVHLGTFKPNLGRFSTWLYHIARNVVRTFLGRSLRRPAPVEVGPDRTLEERLGDASAEADPAEGVLRAEAEAEVRAALAELPERTRTVLALRYYDNMDYQSIATTMGLSLGNVKTLIHRGKFALAQKLRQREDAAESAAARTNASLKGFGELQLV